MKREVISVIALVVCSVAHADIRIKLTSHSESSGPGVFPQTEVVIFAHDTYRRSDFSATPGSRAHKNRDATESPQPQRMATIQHCDQRISYVLNLDTHEYTESPLPDISKELATNSAEQKPKSAPNLIIEMNTIDTGETKTVFGHAAHHYVTTTKQTPSPDLTSEPTETVDDAWYLDVPDVRSCQTSRGAVTGLITVGVVSHANNHGAEQTQVRPEFHHSGPVPQGLVVSSKQVTRSLGTFQNGEKHETTFTTYIEVTELSEEPLDPTLFQIPPEFKKVKKLNFIGHN